MERAKRYGIAALVGIAVFAVLAWHCYGQRGGFAVGGESMALLMPFWYAAYRMFARGEL